MTTIQITTAGRQFEQLFLRTRSRVYKLAYRLTGNAADAEDLTQDAYMSAWRHFDSFDTRHSFESWLFRILVNRARDLYRRKKRVRFCSFDAPSNQDGDEQSRVDAFADPAAGPEETVISSILTECVEAALMKLPVNYRTAVLLCDVEQCSYQEVADRMHTSLGTVRSRIHRARSLLRRYVEAEDAIRSAGVQDDLRN
jgi:RNA polymerase sigma-70 factor (ECF subfamily)